MRAVWQLSGRRAFIKYERDDNAFWFNPVMDEHRPKSSTPGFPCNRGDIFLKLGMRGARLIPWRLKEGDVFRLGQAYVLVAKVRTAADTSMDVSALSPYEESEEALAAAKAAGIRAEIDIGGRSLGKQIKVSNQEKVSMYAVIGAKEVEERSLSLTSRVKGDLGSFGLDDALGQMKRAAEGYIEVHEA